MRLGPGLAADSHSRVRAAGSAQPDDRGGRDNARKGPASDDVAQRAGQKKRGQERERERDESNRNELNGLSSLQRLVLLFGRRQGRLVPSTLGGGFRAHTVQNTRVRTCIGVWRAPP